MSIVILGLFGIAVLWMAVYGYRISAKTAEDYMLAGRGIGIIVMFFLTLFGISSAWTFYGYPGFLYRHGPSFVYFVWGCVVGFVSLYMFLGPRLWAVAKLNHFLSPVEILSKRYESNTLRFVLALVLLASIIPYIGLESLGVGLGFKAFAGFHPAIGIIYTTILLIFIILLGGMRMTAWTNILLGIIYTTTFLGSLLWIIHIVFPHGLPQAVQILAAKGPKLLYAPGPKVVGEPLFTHPVIVGVFITGFMAFSWPHIVMGALTVRDKSIFKWLPLLGIAAGGIGFYTIPFLWGSLVAPAISHMDGTLVPVASGKAADNIVQVIITKYLPGWFSAFALMGVVAAALSTAAIQLMTSAILVSRDLIHGFFKPDATDKQLITWTKFAVIGLIILSLGIAVWNPMALALYLTHVAVPGFAQWAPCLAGGILWKRGTKQGAIAGVLAGTALLIVGFICHFTDAIILSFIINTLIYIVVSLLTPKPSDQVERIFFDEVEEFLKEKA
ncbi:MAG: sodium:solute symporter family protein [Deltaproteobacteria bacterium]|nr:sodium:solute symporter family protein [Deltaproteobacteria bacterium]